MSELAEVTPTTEPPTDTPFGADFEAALAAAFGEERVEPKEPKPDIVEPVAKPEPTKQPETIDDVVEKDDEGPELPIDDPIEVEEKEEEPDTTGMTKAAGERFKELRAEAKTIKTQLATEAQARATAEARIKELEALNGQSEEITKKLADYELELSISRLEATEPYQRSVTEPLAEIATIADTIAKKYEIDASKLLDAIAIADTAEQDEAFDELLSGVGERDKLKIYAQAERLPKIMAERARLHEDRDSALAELEARKSDADAAAAVENAKARKAAVELVESRVVSKLPFLKTDSFDVAAAVSKVVDADFDALDVTTKAYNAVSGHLVPQLAKAYLTVMRELETVTDELGKYKKASPAPKGAAGSPLPTDTGGSFVDNLERAFASIGA